MLKEILKTFNLSKRKIDKLNRLREICLEYNKHINLTSITNEQDFNVKHIFDSLSILKFYDLNNKKILDVGSGGGFPGLVLAIVLENSEITMIDSNNKKINYINYVIQKLNLKNTLTIYSRVEEANITEKYDVVVSRAVASLNILLEITSFALKISGRLIFYKSNNLNNEFPSNWKKILDLGVSFEKDNSIKIDENTTRRIISFIKYKKTNKKFPRNYNLIKSKPLF